MAQPFFGKTSFTTVLLHMYTAIIWGKCYMHSNDNGSAHGCNISLPKLLLGACPMFLNTDESLALFLGV